MSYTPQPGTIPARVIAWLQKQPVGGMFASAVLADALEIDSTNIAQYLEYPVKHGAVVSEKRDGRKYWGLPTNGRMPALPEPDDEPPVQRVVEVRLPSPEEHAAAEVLQRIGFPVPDGKHSISPNVFLLARGKRGRASFVLRYTSAGGQRREMGLGPFLATTREGAVRAIVTAMRKSERQLAAIVAGADPLDGKPKAKSRARGSEVTTSGAASEDWQLRLNELQQVPAPKPMRCAVWSDGALSIERAGQRLDLTTDEARTLCNYLDVVRGGDGG